MNTKDRIVRALLFLYPAEWRREYGPELTDLLQSRPLNARTIADVLFGGLRQRARSAEPWLILGTAALFVIAGQFAWSLATATGGGDGLTALVRPSGMTFPTYTVVPMAGIEVGNGYQLDLYAFLLLACGWWTAARHRCGTLSRSGFAAVKLTLLAGFPIFIAGLMMLTGARGTPPSALEVMTAPVFMLPQHWLFGYMGGAMARPLSRFVRRRPTTS